ncbi:MAG: hypothetical protein V1489_00825 [Candidatus Liptonbacteria bacterium]
MNHEKGKLLAELLEEVAADGGFFPTEAWHAIHNAVNVPYCEVGVVRKINGEWKVYMKRMRPNDADFPGDPWEIPGGLFQVHFNNRDEAAEEIAKKDIGVPVKNIHETGTIKWHVSRGNGISHVCVCEEDGKKVEENDRAKFVGRNELPSPLVPYQEIFAGMIFDYLAKNEYPE